MIINTVIAGGGTTPTGTIQITSNGITDVTNYANADVQVPTTAPAHYIEKTVDANGKLVGSANIINLNGVTDIGDYALYGAYYYSAAISGVVDMSDLTTISGEYACDSMFYFCGLTSFDLSALITISGSSACNSMFNNCTGLTSANLPALTTISGDNACNTMFYSCTGLISVDLSALTTISGGYACDSMFYFCGLTSFDLSALTTISGNYACQYMFDYCSGLTSANLPALTEISGEYACQYMFEGCTSLATVYIGGTTAIDFGTYTNQFEDMFSGCSQNIDVYAPAANQSQIEAFSGYPNFGGTGTVTWHWRS